MTDAESMIECEALTKRFGHFTAVDHVSFSVAKGSIFGFLGPNGSGKSTVIRMLCGLLDADRRHARASRALMSRSDADELKSIIGYMSQKFSLYDELTRQENLLFYGRLYGLCGARTRQRRDQNSSRSRISNRISTAARRCFPAAGVNGSPWPARSCTSRRVLFLDEPTAGIDPVARRELWDLLFEFSGQGMTLFVTTHYMDEAERCSHVGYIHMSKLIVCGEPDELKHLPAGQSARHQAARRHLRSCDHRACKPSASLPGVSSATVFGQSMHLLVDESLVGDRNPRAARRASTFTQPIFVRSRRRWKMCFVAL